MHPFRTHGTAPSLDELNRALLITGAAAMLLKMFFEQGSVLRFVLTAIAFAALLFALLRLLSKNPAKTNTQNLKYLAAVTAVRDFFRAKFKKTGKAGAGSTPRTEKKRRIYPTLQELRQYKYFMCPQCTQRLRVPRKKGRLRVTCTCCGNRFEVKS